METQQRIFPEYSTYKQKVDHCLTIREQVKDIYDRFSFTTQSDSQLTAIWLKEYCNIEIAPEVLDFLQRFKLTRSVLDRAGRYWRARDSVKYGRDREYAKILEDAHVSAFMQRCEQ